MANLRLTAGTLRGRSIPLPEHEIRPTSSIARQAFFNIVAQEIPGSVFLDLFAGTGIFSFEAVSRGAESATAVDNEPRALRAIAARAADWKLPIRTVSGDVLRVLAKLPDTFSIVYADPPYEWNGYHELLHLLDSSVRLRPGAVVGIEHRSGEIPLQPARAERLAFRKSVRHGNVSIALFDAAGSDLHD